MSRDILHAKGRLSIEVLLAMVIVREDTDGMLGHSPHIVNFMVQVGDSKFAPYRSNKLRNNFDADLKL
jgi:hypothetical protein